MKTKRVLSAILACVLILFTCPLQASAISNTVVSSIEKTNSTWYGYPDKADIYVASSIAYMGQNGRLRGRHGHSTLGLPEQDQQTGETAEVMLM